MNTWTVAATNIRPLFYTICLFSVSYRTKLVCFWRKRGSSKYALCIKKGWWPECKCRSQILWFMSLNDLSLWLLNNHFPLQWHVVDIIGIQFCFRDRYGCLYGFNDLYGCSGPLPDNEIVLKSKMLFQFSTFCCIFQNHLCQVVSKISRVNVNSLVL